MMENLNLITRILTLILDALEQENVDNAEFYFDCIRRLDPSKLPVKMLSDLGSYAEKIGEVDTAIEYFQYIINRDENQIETRMRLANLCILQGRFEDAIQILNQTILRKDSYLEAHQLLREANYLQIRFESALDQYVESLNLNASHSFIVYRYKGLVLFTTHQYASAIEIYKKALSFEGSDAETLELLYEMGLAYLFINELDLAEEIFEKILDFTPNHMMALTQLSHIFAVNDDIARAAALIKQAIDTSTQKNSSYTQLPPTIELDESLSKYRSPTPIFFQKGIPIIYIHRNMGQDPLIATPIEYSLAQAKKTNPTSDIYLISDGSIKFDFVNLEFMIDYYESAHQFARVYKHICKRVRYDYLLFCSQRWFILKEFMIRKGFERCVHVDSDVMLFSNLTEVDLEIGTYDFKMSAHPDFAVSGHYNFIGSYSILEKFCNYLYDMYATPFIVGDTSPMKISIWHTGAGYITDMSAFEEFTQRGFGTMFNLSSIFSNSTFDANINSADGFETRGGMKNIYWRDNIAFCKRINLGQEIRFHGLHFNERAKKFMKNAYLHQSLYKPVY